MAVAALACARDAVACSCMSSGPPCQAAFQVDAVFIGTVRSIDLRKVPMDGMATPVDRRMVHIAVERVVRGVEGTVVDVWTGMGGGDCGFDFKAGERYVVYAWRRDGALTTGICSRTRLLSDAAEDLAYFAALPSAPSAGVVSGTIVHFATRGPDVPTEKVPVADVQVLLRSTGGVFSGMTDPAGRYTIAHVPPGTYDFEVLPPSGFSRRFLGAHVELKDPRACVVQDFGLRYDGRVSGTLVDGRGKPVADLRVDIAPADRPEDRLPDSRATSDAFGHFELTDVPPGRYIVGIGFTQYPNDGTVYPRTLFATAAEVGAGAKLEIGGLTVPEPRRPYELTGVIVDVNGVAVPGANLVVRGPRFQQLSPVVTTAADGSFQVTVFEGQAITLHSWYDVSASPMRQASRDLPMTISGPPPPVRLVLVVR
jgi:hypothetical protein